VELALERGSALRVGHLFWGSGTSFLVQEDLRASGRVERHLVVRGRVVASAVATPARGEHRSNFALGGRFESIDPRTSRAAELARRAVAAIGLPLAAVDTIGEREPRLLEVNASPGFEGLSAAVGRDLLREAVVELLAGAGRAGSAVAAAAPSRA
jgi:ribosomal protein S6--L-glutamate ligase